jgi:hypothetical protein
MDLHAALILIELGFVLPVIAPVDPDLLTSQAGDAAEDLVVGASFLKVGNQVLDRDPAGGELEPSATPGAVLY